LKELFKEEEIKDKKVKEDAIYMAYIEHGYRMKQIEEYLGVHYATVSRAGGTGGVKEKTNSKVGLQDPVSGS